MENENEGQEERMKTDEEGLNNGKDAEMSNEMDGENESGDEESTDSEEEDTDTEDPPADDDAAAGMNVYVPGQSLEEGEVGELVCDESAYVMYHQAQTGAPCLSFDILADKLGENRETFPLTCYMVAGTQSAQTNVNNVVVMKMSNLHKVEPEQKPFMENDSDEEMDKEEKLGNQPIMATAMIQHPGAVNRIRASNVNGKQVAATWSDNGTVFIWDLTKALHAVNDLQAMKVYVSTKSANARALHSFTGHQSEGFAMDWSSFIPGQLITGDCRKNIHLWKTTDSGWNVEQRSYVGHTESVEDLQWSPAESSVFASCSVDRSIRVWDSRLSPLKANVITIDQAHDGDVNVISWNKNEQRFIASGGDDGVIKIWDLSQYKKGDPLAVLSPVSQMKQHSAPITSIEWHPTDSSVFAASGADDQLIIWDLSVESEDSVGVSDEPDVPSQVLFIHQGQKEIKELHWHPQLPGVIVSTAHSGFNIFRTISV